LYIIYALAIQIGIYSRQALFRDIKKKTIMGYIKNIAIQFLLQNATEI